MDDGPTIGPIRVMVVDDDHDHAVMTARRLEQDSDALEVVTEHSARTAFDRIEEENVECVVCDYRMPRMDGLELLGRVREEHDDLPFIIYTGKGSDDVAQEALSAGADDYFQKTTDYEQYQLLASRVETLVAERRARQRAERTEGRFSKLIENSPVAIRTMSADGEITYVSPSTEPVLGYEPEELLGESGFGYVHPDDRETVRAAYERLVDAPGETVTAEYRYQHPDDGWIWVRSRGRNLLDDSEVGALVINTEDISEHKQRERALEHYETIIEGVADGVFTLDADGRITYINRYIEEAFGVDRTETIGTDIAEYLGDDTQWFEAAIGEMLRGELDTATLEATIRTPDGTEIPIEASITLLPFDETGEFRGTAGVWRDISDRKQRERELERKNERLEEFASIVSHDLRNPLNVITGRVELARGDPDPEHLDEIEAAAERMDALIADVLTLARQGELVGDTERVDIGRLASRIWDRIETGAATLDVSDDLGYIEADASRLEQLLVNLFTNAVEHGGESVAVRIGPLHGSGFYVEDDGPGIPEGERDSVFDHGYTTSEQGTGFGLSIVRTVSAAHGWDIAATESDSGGARFEITGCRVDPG